MAPEPRLREHRQRCRLTQEELAEQLTQLAWASERERVGVNADMVSKWERGLKRPSKQYRLLLAGFFGVTQEQLGLRGEALSDSVPSAAEAGGLTVEDVDRRNFLRATAALGIGAVLPAVPFPRRYPEAEIEPVRAALLSHEAFDQEVFNGRAPSVKRLQRDVARAWEAFQESRYGDLTTLAPAALRHAQAAAQVLDGDERRAATVGLSQAYQITAVFLLKLGDAQGGWLAADRGLHSATVAEDSIVLGAAARIFAYSLLAAGQYAAARDLTLRAANQLEGGLNKADGRHLSVYGSLLLKGAMASAHVGDRVTSRALLGEADVTARRLGRDANYCWTAFGPSNVTVHRVSAAVAAVDPGGALQAAHRITPGQLAVPERRAQHLLDVARGYGLAGRDELAVRTLLDAEKLAAEEIRYQPASRHLVSSLLERRGRGVTPELRALATRIGAAA